MTRERAKELLPVIQAFAEGKTIQFKLSPGDEWDTCHTDSLSWFNDASYRIKPEPQEWWVPDCTCVCYSVSEAITSGINREQFRLFREVEGAKL